MHLRRLKALACVITAAFAATALAQAPTPATPPTNPSTGTGATPGGIPPDTTAPGNRATLDFGAVDSDRDGFISRAEASRASLGGQFTTLDKNNDGRLDPAEFAAHRADNVRIPDTRIPSSTTGTMSRR